MTAADLPLLIKAVAAALTIMWVVWWMEQE